jgi:hypothetical protein
MLAIPLVSCLLCCTAFCHALVLERAPRTSHAPAKYANSTSRSTLSSTVSNAPTLCTGCQYGEPGYQVEFNWPGVLTTKLVLATVIYKVDPNNVTSTITRYNNATLDGSLRTVLDAAQWNEILSTTGVTVKNGTPHFNYVATVYTAPGAPITVSSTL